MWLLAVSCCFVAGVGLTLNGQVHPAILTAIAIGVWLLLAREWRIRGLSVLFLCVAFAFLGAWRCEPTHSSSTSTLVAQFNAEGEIAISGRVSTDPEPSGPYQRIVLDGLTAELPDATRPVDGKVRATLHYAGPLHYGDIISLRGELRAPCNFSDFDYVGYVEQHGIVSTMFCPSVLRVEPPESIDLLLQLHSLSDTLKQSLDHALPQPQASLAQTLLLGRRDSLSDDVRDDFARAGAAHMLAVSGLHLAIVTAVVLAIALALLGRWKYLYVWIALAAVAGYVLLTGMRPPVVRAGIMAAVFLLAELAGRQKHGATALGFAAAIMIGMEPGLLTHTSFQLSFLAMAGLMVLYGPLREWLAAPLHHFNPDSDHTATVLSPVLDIVAATIAATAMTLPVIARTFGELPMLTVPVSVLALPLLPLAIAGAALAAIGGILAQTLGVVLGWIAWIPLTYLLDLTGLASHLTWATVSVGAPRLPVEIAYYCVLVLAALLWQRRGSQEDKDSNTDSAATGTNRLWYAVPPLLLAVVITWSAVTTAPDGRLHVTFFDVGQGDACLIVTPDGHTVVVDGGRDGVVMANHLGRTLPFWDHSLDVVVDTHQHEDHLAGLMTVVRNYDVGLAMYPEYEDMSALTSEWLRLLSEKSVPARLAHAGQEMDFGDGTTLQVIGPSSMPPTSDCDENSVVLRITYGDVVFLMTGDIASDTETALCHAVADISCTVLKVAHHGSDTSSCVHFLRAARPQLGIVSVGADNEYGHPAPDVLERLHAEGATVITTADHGSIECVTDGTTVDVRSTQA